MKKMFLCLAGLLALILASPVYANTCRECDTTFWPEAGENGRLCPDCRPPDFLTQLAISMCERALSRGENDSLSQAVPKVVKVEFGKWDTLKKGEQPVWDEKFATFYDGMKKDQAKDIADRVNSARKAMNPDELAKTAMMLGKFKEKKDIPVYFKADTLFTEAIHLAVLCGKIGNQPALIRLKTMYEKAPFKNADTLEELKEEIKAIEKPAKEKK